MARRTSRREASFRMATRRTPFFAGALALVLLTGCHHDTDDSKAKQAHQQLATSTGRQCTSDADCATGKPCVRARCVDGHCRAQLATAGTDCDNGDVCDGVARCDQRGVCSPGAPPAVDDKNACTVDSCDPVRGVLHTPVDVDDHDVRTTRRCNPANGVTHTPVDTDDGDDCTFDSCDPEAGVTHKKPESVYTCNSSCGAGYHPVSRSPSAQCGGRDALQTFCAPDCEAPPSTAATRVAPSATTPCPARRPRAAARKVRCTPSARRTTKPASIPATRAARRATGRRPAHRARTAAPMRRR